MRTDASLSTPQGTSTTKIPGKNNLGSKDIFLKILVAQMQNQDPLKPRDAAQMSTQLAQFNMVEQQINTNRLLEKMLADIRDNTGIATAASYLGHQATAQVSSFHFNGSTPIQLGVDAGQDATGASVLVMDNAGRVVKTLYNGFLQRGVNPLTWRGDTDNGATAPAGDYSLKVIAKDSNGHDVTVRTRITGKITALRTGTDGISAVIGDTLAPMANIAEIR